MKPIDATTRAIRIAGILLTTLASQALAATNLVVIAHPASGVTRMSRGEVSAVFMGRAKKLPSGTWALPVDQTGGTNKLLFYREIVGKELPEITAHWARIIFSGQGSPPRQIDSVAEVIDIVSNNKGAIGYIPSGAVDGRVAVVLDLSIPDTR